jgi:glutamate-5-semialdehyde dehydrogenase
MADLKAYIEGMADAARRASAELRVLDTERKNAALASIAEAIGARRAAIREANARDLERGKAAKLSSAFLDRLTLTDARIDGIISSLREIIALEDPIGEVTGSRRPAGFTLEKVRTPIGVICMIFESRPNVTVDTAALCLKSGNAAILRGGSEALESNAALIRAVAAGLSTAGVDPAAVQYVERTEHEAVDLLVTRTGTIDLVMPRGGEGLIRRVAEKATVPVIKHYKGVCHIYVDPSADLAQAAAVVANAKVNRPGTCNALEKVLVHRDAAAAFLPLARAAMPTVELRGDEAARAILPGIAAAAAEDWDREYLDLILTVKVVDSLDEAIQHIALHGSSHTDGICATDSRAIERFVAAVDSSVVTVNASTRLNDGGVFGLGAELGCSTDKLHARGPMGLRELTTYKWVVRGNGDVRK